MTLGEFISYLGDNPYYPLFFFFILPIAALLGNYMAKGEGHETPWCVYYSVLIYLVVVPGIFAILLNLYHILFEKRSIYEVNVMVEILPVLSMVLTLFVIKKNVSFDDIPGFGKMTSFLSLVTILMLAFFLLEKTHLIVFSYLPFQYVLLILAVVFFVIRLGTKKLFS